MKKLFAIAVLCLAAGCSPPNEAFVRGVDAGWKRIGPLFRTYVDGDQAITQAQKDERKATADELQTLIEQAKLGLFDGAPPTP